MSGNLPVRNGGLAKLKLLAIAVLALAGMLLFATIILAWLGLPQLSEALIRVLADLLSIGSGGL